MQPPPQPSPPNQVELSRLLSEPLTAEGAAAAAGAAATAGPTRGAHAAQEAREVEEAEVADEEPSSELVKSPLPYRALDHKRFGARWPHSNTLPGPRSHDPSPGRQSKAEQSNVPGDLMAHSRYEVTRGAEGDGPSVVHVVNSSTEAQEVMKRWRGSDDSIIVDATL